jgi:Ala-tRNA(Pro) deacylase
MPCKERLLQLLDSELVWYEVLSHREAFTAQDVAQLSHVSGKRLAKVVVVREGLHRYHMCVIPAHAHVDFAVLRLGTGLKDLGLAGESEIARLFPDCEIGTMPPFGRLYGLPMWLDACLREASDIYFQAGNRHEVVHMLMSDYLQVAGPPNGVFCMHGALHLSHT